MIRIGLIGHGYWGKRIHEKLNLLTNDVLIQTSSNYNPSVFSELQWVFIATPVHSHYQIAKDCLTRGANVFIEKPFCSRYEQAIDLLNLAYERNLSLYIDDVFIHRHELIALKKSSFSSLLFKWHKYGPFNDNIFNDLVYHDLYILIYLNGVQEFSRVEFVEDCHDSLKFKMVYGKLQVEFDYNRRKTLSSKIIKTETVEISFNDRSQDPLLLITENCLKQSCDFKSNNVLHVQTMKLFTDLLSRRIV